MIGKRRYVHPESGGYDQVVPHMPLILRVEREGIRAEFRRGPAGPQLDVPLEPRRPAGGEGIEVQELILASRGRE